MFDFIEYEIVNWEPREVWKCQGACAKYHHRRVIKGTLTAICCGVPAKLIDRYSQPMPLMVSELLPASLPAIAAAEIHDEGLELVMAQMQSAALVFPEPAPEPTQQLSMGTYKS